MKKYTKLGVLIGFCLIVASANELSISPGKLIIDTDAGADDAAAILLALWAEEQIRGLKIIAITCTYGNTNVTNVASNVLKILTIANRSDIPVYIGTHKSLLSDYTSSNWFGEDGMGDFEFEEKIIAEIDRSKHASIALTELAKRYSGSVSILVLGPLTNVALAFTLDPDFVKNVQRFYIMGSSVHGIGNAAPNVEANFQQDPVSNFVVLNGTRGLPVALFPWETALSAAIPTKWRTEILGVIDSRRMKFLNQAERKSLNDPTWDVADVMMTALILWPELITRTLVTNVTPVFDGIAQGSVLVDYSNMTGKPPNVEILEAFDVEGFKEILLKAFA